MLKRISLCILAAIIMLALGACSSSVSNPAVKPLEAKDVTDILKASGLPLDNIIIYDESTDPNDLLGRPNQYISKVNFADMRLEQFDLENPAGGSVEVFKSAQDLAKRKTYVEELSKTPMFAQYIFSKDLILLRVDKGLTPQEADQYKQVLDNLKDPPEFDIAIATPAPSLTSAAASTPAPPPAATLVKTYGLGEEAPIIVDGVEIGKLTIDKVTVTKKRNQFADQKPAQVVLVEYTYKNTASDEPLRINGNLHFQVIDESGAVCDSYPNIGQKDSKNVPIGAKCTASEFFGLEAVSKTIKLNYLFNMYQDQPTISFELPVG